MLTYVKKGEFASFCLVNNESLITNMVKSNPVNRSNGIKQYLSKTKQFRKQEFINQLENK